jgi:RNA polymerase sigma-70 factor (ECF subfamily)
MHLDHSIRSAMLNAMPQLRAFAISLCRDFDRANDLVQETLLRACTNIEKFKAGSNMVSWLCTIMYNQYCSDYRKRRREVEDIDGMYANTLAIEPDQITHLEYEDMRAALAELPNEMRETLVLIGVEGISYERAARACNCSVGTVKSRAHRARERLGAMLSIDKPAIPAGIQTAGRLPQPPRRSPPHRGSRSSGLSNRDARTSPASVGLRDQAFAACD